MMATAEPPNNSSFLPLLESLEDSAAGQSEHTDAYLTIANRFSGEDGRHFLPAVEKHFPRLGKVIRTHILSPNAELCQAALQVLGFCVYHSRVGSGVPETFAAEILSELCSLVLKSTDKNTCTRALWVISKQSFPPDVVAKKVSSILEMLQSVWSREDVQSVVMEHEALNVVIRLLEQAPAQMGDGAVRWAKLVIPLVVHSASKVRLRAAAAMEMGMPLLLGKQMEVAAVIEPMMCSKLIPELQKLFMSKNETNVLKLWPLFVKLLGKLLHRGGPFINSLLHLEELGFRSSSATIKKIAFIAWKSLIDNFALNPDILCSSKRMKLLLQPLASIHVRTEALLLTKVEVWWYLVVQLGPNLSANFDQVSVPLLQCTIGSDVSSVSGTPSRAVAQNGAVAPGTPKTANSGLNSPANMSRLSLNSSVQIPTTYPSIQLLGLEMLFHYFLGPEVIATAAKNKLILSLEPLNHSLLSGASSFTKHAAVLTSTIRDGFINIGKDAPDALLAIIWTSLVRFVNLTIESGGGSKKDRQGCEVLTLTLQALQSIVASEAVPANKVLILLEATVKGVPQRVLGSASYQVGKMDVLNGTPALFLILLLYNSSLLAAYIEDDRFFQCLQTLVGCGLSGPTSPLAFGEAVLGAIGRSAGSVQNKEQLWRMWSVVVGPLTDTITQSNEVNQGDALEHNFSAIHSALLFPITHLLHGTPLQQATQKSLLSTWSKLYKVFARCSALVVTAEENICCEELCAKMTTAIDSEALKVPSTLNAVASILQVMVECVDFSPYTPQFQQKLKSPHTPVNWMKKRNKVLGNLSTFQCLLVQCLEVYLEAPEASSEGTGLALTSVLSALFSNVTLANTVIEALTSMIRPLALFYKQASCEPPKFTPQLLGKLEKLLGEVLGCLQTCSALAYDDELLALLAPLLCVVFPHKNKQLRSSVTQFWNATFASSVSLTYPEEIRPILSQVKLKTPIILPGFQVVSVPDELSGQYSSESSQLETKLSGMPVSSVGKRDSLLGKAPELKDRSSTKTSKPVSTKLDFGSPKPPRREVLEEEASIDFVFIPPETKERVLTEHQKEVKRTKRVDIPAMYNNLDASLDTTVFTQYTQSQEDSLDKLPTEQAEKGNAEPPGKVPQEDVANEDNEVQTKETQDYASPSASESITESHEPDEMIPESADVSVADDARSDGGAQSTHMHSKEDVSPNSSGASDLVSGTPQKPNSRRQSFITLEKYSEGKPASPSSVSTFTGPLIKTSNSQEHSTTNKTPSSQASTTTAPNSEESRSTGKLNSQRAVNDAPESPLRPRDSGRKCEPVKLTERMPSDATDDDDVIPDTQTEAEGTRSTKMASTSEELQPSSQEEESELSQSSMSQTSPGEPRRSGRHRIRPLLPGEDADECEEKFRLKKRRRSEEELVKDSPKSSSLPSRPSTRSRQAAEEDSSTDRLRTRGQRDRRESSQDSQGRAHKKVKLYSNSQKLLDNPEPRRRSARESSKTDSQSDTQSDYDSQSQGRRGRRSKSSLESTEEVGRKKPVLPDKEESSQAESHELTEPTVNDDKPKNDSHMVTSLSVQSQESELMEQTKRAGRDSQVFASSPTVEASQDTVSPTNMLVNESAVKDEHNTRTDTDDNLSQDDSQVVTSSASESQSRRRSRRSKASSEAAESQDTSESKDSSRRQSKSISQASPSVVNNAEATIGGRTRKTRVQEGQSQESPLSTPENSQSLNITGSAGSSQGRGRYSRRRSSQALVASVESSESESAEARENLPVPKKRGRKPRISLPSPLTAEIKVVRINTHMKESHCYTLPSQKADAQAENTTDLEDSQKTQESECLEMQPSHVGSPTDGAVEESDTGEKNKSKSLGVEKQRQKDTEMTVDDTSSQKSGELQSTEMLESVELSAENTEENSPCDPSLCPAASAAAPPAGTPEELPAAGSSEETVEKLPAAGSSEETMEKLPAAGSSEETVEKLPAAGSSEETVEKLPAAGSSEETVEKLPAAGSSEESMEKLPAAGSSEETVEKLPAAGSSEETVEKLPAAGSSEETVEKLPAAGSSEEKAAEVSEPGDNVEEKQSDDSDSDHKEHPVVSGEDTCEGSGSSSFGPNHMEGPDVTDDSSKEDKQQCSINGERPTNQHTESRAQSASDITPLQDGDEEVKTPNMECQDEEQTENTSTETRVTGLDEAQPHACNASVLPESTSNVFQGSPVKQKDLEAVMGPDVGQSPSSGRTRGTWSPSASPSTSILKKGQKRPLEDETPSPLVKSRHVSFADPIQQQELADDIDRRSPAIRTSSPRRSKISNLPQPKYVTTPTKGLLVLSPRNLHSPGYKSSKKCLISEMSQEPRPVSRDCIYPALVGCSTPVEAVLPQISSNMWSRGFGQLVRARNIKTVGDLSALTPSEIKTLPIRSPKISNVKKALKSYELQRKGRGGDELKSFDETEMMISEVETSGPQNQDEEDKTSGETLATELMDECVPAEAKVEQGGSETQTADTLTPERVCEGGAHVEGLASEVEALTCRMTPLELSGCSAQQLVHMHHQLGGMMRSVVLELHTRLSHTNSKP